MIYEVAECKMHMGLGNLGLGCWRAEASDDEGCCYVAIFSGPNAERLAQEYAAWKNQS